MNYLKGIYDSSSKRLMIEFTNCLLRDHFNILEGSFEKYKLAGYLPKEMTIQKLESTKCLIIIPIEIKGADKLENGQSISGLPTELTEKLVNAIEEFRNIAIKEEFSTTEFIPLKGYPLKNLQTDILEAIRNKRNFCIIDDYAEYLKFSTGKIKKLKQIKVMYPTNEYSDVAIYIKQGNMNTLKKEYMDKLEETDWE